MKRRSFYRHPITLRPDSARVIIRPFLPGAGLDPAAMIDRVLALTDRATLRELNALRREFSARHIELEKSWLARYESMRGHCAEAQPLPIERQLLIGALFCAEYSLESAALFNPSIVPHPDQAGVASGGLRFIMSLRATGEGHVSSIEFRSGLITPAGEIEFEVTSRYVTMPEVVPNPTYHKANFLPKFREMGFDNAYARAVMAPLGSDFTLSELNISIGTVRDRGPPDNHELMRTMECAQWLAESNYELRFSPGLHLSERIIFPVSANESHGIEDARFVRFVEDDGVVRYFATYTAYNGRAILPMLIETADFMHFRVRTLNGSAVQDKGMALFPRRINGRYAMLSRQDNENILIMFSENLHFWSDPQVLLRPAEPWEAIKLGNCGSPIETAAGWLVITHGVGPMRKYCIGAALLDRADPTLVIGRLRRPLLSPEGMEREGYVPNVVYSCGSLVHDGRLILPYAMSDSATAVASMPLQSLLRQLKTGA